MKTVKKKALSWKTILKRNGLEACDNPKKKMNHYDNHSSVIIEIGFEDAYLISEYFRELYEGDGLITKDSYTEDSIFKLYKILNEYENT